METIGIPPDKHETYENEEGKPLSAGKSSGERVSNDNRKCIRNVVDIKGPRAKKKGRNIGVSVEAIDLHISKEVATTRQAYYYGVLQEIWVLDYRFRQIPLFKYDWVNHKSGGVKRDKLGYTLVDLNNLGHKVATHSSDSYSTSQISTSEEIDYDSPEPPKKIIDISSDSSDDRRWAAKKASALVFYGPSTQGLLDAYGYGTIEEYLEWNYFPSTDNESTNMETTDKGNTDKDCIDDSNSAMSKGKYVPVCKKNNPNMYSHVPVTGCVLGLASVTTWDEIEKKIGARKTKTCADKAKGKRKVNLMIDKLNISAASLKFLLLLEVLKNYSK
ncbi:hypothetical protein Tco_0843180 [Tanacetum coccineum]|uniref:DUF4216 domain-containing protein n=1 Tax=Tanacetum coccineum TaxID=301880 RepID=A0ABQ5B5C3_9ASTR